MSLENDIKKVILDWNENGLKEICKSKIENQEITATEILRIIGTVMRFIGELFEKEEIFLPDLIGSAECVKNVIDEVLDPAIRASGEKKAVKGIVIIGTVESDVHSIGKDLVASFLFSNGYEVYNLGVDVPTSKFIEKAEETGAQVIALSSLLTMSMDFQRQIITELKNRGIRNKYKIIVGGAPTSEDWADQIGADGWADDAVEAVALVKKLLKIK